MAGPGGGPPRRSHTKSRNGCEACKKRHIRCDESFPQCRNCTKHKVRCPYNDHLPAENRDGCTSDAQALNLLWTPENRKACQDWLGLGKRPWFHVRITAYPDPRQYSLDSLRLLDHVVTIFLDLEPTPANSFTLWTRHIPTIFSIGVHYPFVMEALLAFSASHMSDFTSDPRVAALGYEHQGAALSGLNTTITNLNQDNADAVFACSIVLSWLASDRRSWHQHWTGTTAIIQRINQYKQNSPFLDLINELSTFPFPEAPGGPEPGHVAANSAEEDRNALDRAAHQLQIVETYLKQQKEDHSSIAQLITFLKGAKKVHTSSAVHEQFDRLKPLRGWLFSLPVQSLQRTKCTPSTLLVIAHQYMVGLLMEIIFPEVSSAYFGSFAINPLEDIYKYMHNVDLQHRASGAVDQSFRAPLEMMEEPLAILARLRSRVRRVGPPATPPFPLHPQFNQFSPSGPVVDDNAATSFTGSAMPYATPAFSYSQESFDFMGPDSVPPSAVSPASLSPYSVPPSAVSPASLSPSMPAVHYLGVPSPNYNSYSPDFKASQSPNFSDEEFYEMFTSPSDPSDQLYGAPADHFDLGLNPPMQQPPPNWDSSFASDFQSGF